MHPKTIEWDSRMKAMFDRIDAVLEDKYHGAWTLRRNRPLRDETSNPEADGLFNVGASFTPGFGSEHGRGYLVLVEIATSERVDENQRVEIETFVVDLLERFLPEHFPERRLSVVKDGTLFKIRGDLSLGSI